MTIAHQFMLRDVYLLLERHGFNCPETLSDKERLEWIDKWLSATKQKQIKKYRDAKSPLFYAYVNQAGNVEGIEGNQTIYGGAEEIR